MPSGGFVLDSKIAILRSLEASGHIARADLIGKSLTSSERVARLREIIATKEMNYPVVLKPDFGERGNGVLIARDPTSAADYLSGATEDTIVQAYIPGVEYGVFYERFPGEETGRITGITHKAATRVIGDGKSSLERLILADPRAVALAPVFLEIQSQRLGEIIGKGQSVKLNLIGTHSRGSLFLDACEATTHEMEAAIEKVSRHFEGFHLGRYDIRCPSLDALQKGEDFHIVELNGVTSEPTHMYDPRHGVFHAWKCLAAQWSRAYRIAAMNREAGHRAMPLGDLIDRIRSSWK